MCIKIVTEYGFEAVGTMNFKHEVISGFNAISNTIEIVNYDEVIGPLLFSPKQEIPLKVRSTIVTSNGEKQQEIYRLKLVNTCNYAVLCDKGVFVRRGTVDMGDCVKYEPGFIDRAIRFFRSVE